MAEAPVRVDGELAVIEFDRFDLANYDLFLRTKSLPESRVSYDWRRDTYTVTTPARFAPRLGAARARDERETITLPIAPHLFDYQRWALRLALEARRYALWLDTGLGKTAVYLEFARHVHHLTAGRVLILAPLAVLPQIVQEAQRFYGDDLPTLTLKTREELVRFCAAGPPHLLGLCNYEKFIAGEIPELRYLAALILDESSILKTGGGTIKWNIIKSATGIPFKLSNTATPAPNDAMEYASQAAFLESIRHEGEILWTFFHKNGKSNKYTVKPHAKAALYRFMASWSLYLRDPAAFGFADILADLPAPEIIEERLPITDEQRMAMNRILAEHNAGMFGERLGVTARTKLAQIARGFLYEGKNGTKRTVLFPSHKVQRVAEIVRQEMDAGRRVLVWTTFDAEGDLLLNLLDRGRCAQLTGSMSEAKRLQTLDRFRNGDVRCLISKPQLIGYGLNLQFVKSMVFSGLDDSFERQYQAIRRAYRMGQTDPVRVFFPYIPDLEGLVFENVRQKETRFLTEVAAQEQLYRAALSGALEAA